MTSRIEYPRDPAQEVRLSAETLKPLLAKMLVKRSMYQYDADTVVARMLDADVAGNPAYGCARIPDVLAAIDAGDIDPRARVLTVRETPAMAVLDGSRAAGPVAATKGMELAIAKAREVGVGTVAIGNSQPLGAAGVYASIAAREGMIGQCITSTGKASVAGPGGSAALLGNTAVAWAIPCETGSPPLVFDGTCGKSSWGKLAWLRKYGLEIPGEILAQADQADLAAATLRPDAAGVGFGLSLVASILAGALGGGKLPIHKTRTNTADDSQHFLQVIDISQFVDPARFLREIQSALTDIRAAAANDSVDVPLPAAELPPTGDSSLNETIALHRSDWEVIGVWAAKLKVALPE